jgi:hypothetical protein
MVSDVSQNRSDFNFSVKPSRKFRSCFALKIKYGRFVTTATMTQHNIPEDPNARLTRCCSSSSGHTMRKNRESAASHRDTPDCRCKQITVNWTTGRVAANARTAGRTFLWQHTGERKQGFKRYASKRGKLEWDKLLASRSGRFRHNEWRISNKPW